MPWMKYWPHLMEVCRQRDSNSIIVVENLRYRERSEVFVLELAHLDCSMRRQSPVLCGDIDCVTLLKAVCRSVLIGASLPRTLSMKPAQAYRSVNVSENVLGDVVWLPGEHVLER